MSESGGCPSPRHGQEQLCLGWNAQPGAEGTATAAASAGEQHPSVRPSVQEVDQPCFLWKPHLQEKGGAGWGGGWWGSSLPSWERCGSALGFQPAGTITAARCHLHNAFYRRCDSCRQSLTHPQGPGRCLQGPAVTMDFCSCLTPQACSPHCSISDVL